MPAGATDPYGLAELGLADGSAWAIPAGVAALEPFATSAEIFDALATVVRLRLEAAAAEASAERGSVIGRRGSTVERAVELLAEAMERHRITWRRIAVTAREPDAPILARALVRWRLNPGEALLLVAAVGLVAAPAAVPQLRALAGGGNLTVAVAARLLRAGPAAELRAAAFFSPGAPLFDLALLRPLDPDQPLGRRRLELAPRVVALVRGSEVTDAELARQLRPVAAETAADVGRLRRILDEPPAVTALHSRRGPDAARAALALAATACERRVFFVPAGLFGDPGRLAALLREALLFDAVVCVEPGGRPPPPELEVAVARLAVAGAPVFLDASLAGAAIRHVVIEPPDRRRREAMWRRLAGRPLAGLEQLVTRAPIDAAEARRAVESAARDATLARPLSAASVFAELRAASPPPPGRPIDAPEPAVLGESLATHVADLAVVPGSDAALRLAVIAGAAGIGKSCLAALAAESVGLRAVELDVAALSGRADAAAVLAACVAATRRGWLPVLDRLGEAAARGPELERAIAAALAAASGLVVLAAHRLEALWPSLAVRADVVIELAPPGPEARGALWRALLPEGSNVDVEALALESLAPGAIAEVIARARAGDALETEGLLAAISRLGTRPETR